MDGDTFKIEFGQTAREENDELGGWTGERPLSNGREPPTVPVAEFITSDLWPIVKIPLHVCRVDELAYNPKILSIGPLHYDEPSLKSMEAHKQRFLNRLQEKIARHNISLGDIESAMKTLEGKARNCYSEEFDHINSNDFVRMLVLDACFIVELLRLHEKALEEKDVREPIFGTRWMLPIIGRDLLMLENQLPMFVVQEIYDLTNFGDSDQTPLHKLALKFFETLRPFKDKMPSEVAKESAINVPHLLGLFHSSFVMSTSSSRTERRKLNDYDRLPGKGWVNNATRLSFLGIKFMPQSDDDKHLTIEFKDKRLKIPTLLLDDGTSSLFRNLIAYEQSNRYAEPFFTSLAVFLDSIVDTQKDVDILRNAGIIKQAKGGNNEILDLLNTLTRELELDMVEYCYIGKQMEDINNYCRSPWATMLFSIRNLMPTPASLFSLTFSLVSLVVTLTYLSGSTSNGDRSASAPAPAPSHN